MSEETSTKSPSEAEIVVEKMMAMFGERLVDPDMQPLQFAYQAKLARYQIAVEQTPLPAVEE